MTQDGNEAKNEEPQQERENDSENRDPIDVALFLLWNAFKRRFFLRENCENHAF